jgi:DNA-binding MarR family transcriptional regulator/GNAT superfamily N-acetyltransferase
MTSAVMTPNMPQAKKLPASDYADDQSFYLFRILQSLRQSIRAIDQHSRQLASEHNITVPQLVCLTEISQHPEVSVSELSRLVHLSPSTVVGIVDRLTDKALITKTRGSQDRRRVHLAITDKGNELVGQAPDPIQETFADNFKLLPVEQQINIVKSLETVVDLMNARNMDAAPMLETGSLHTSPEVKQAFWHTSDAAMEQPDTADTKDELVIIRAVEEDKPLVQQFINSSTEWYRSLIAEEDISEHEVDAQWADENFKRREFYIGTNADGEKVGTVTLQFFGEYAYLGYVYVDTKFVGRGYGGQLLNFAREESKRRGMKGMVLIAHPKATWAIKAYQKYGFELTYRDKADILAWNNGALKDYYEDYFMMFLYDLQKLA